MPAQASRRPGFGWSASRCDIPSSGDARGRWYPGAIFAVMPTLRRQRSLVVLAAGCALVATALVSPFTGGAFSAHAEEGIAAPAVCASTPLLSSDLSRTNWTRSIDLPKFDPALGTLESVSISGALKIEGVGRGESTDAAPATIVLKLSVAGELTVPGSPTQTVAPEVSRSFNASTFDGVVDYAGTSGFTTETLNSFGALTPIVLTGGAMTPYIGQGAWTSVAKATGVSSGSGAGNLEQGFNTKAQADVCVAYAYSPPPTTTSSTTTTTTLPPTTTSTTLPPTTLTPTSTSTTTTLLQSGGPTAPPTTAETPNGELPATGRANASIVWPATWCIALGAGMVLFVRRRRHA